MLLAIYFNLGLPELLVLAGIAAVLFGILSVIVGYMIWINVRKK